MCTIGANKNRFPVLSSATQKWSIVLETPLLTWTFTIRTAPPKLKAGKGATNTGKRAKQERENEGDISVALFVCCSRYRARTRLLRVSRHLRPTLAKKQLNTIPLLNPLTPVLSLGLKTSCGKHCKRGKIIGKHGFTSNILVSTITLFFFVIV